MVDNHNHPDRVTMITPVWNGARTIAQTIASVRAQGEHCGQYIVLDSMSNDGTDHIVGGQRDTVTDYVRQKDAGLYDAMNKGIELAKCGIIGIVNADDVLQADALRRVRAAFEDEAVDFVYSDVVVMDEAGAVIGLFKARPDWMTGQTLWHGRDWRFIVAVAHPGLFVRKRVYDALGGFDLRYRLAADHDFIARLIARRCIGTYVPEPLACFRVGGLSGSNLALFAEDERIAIQFGVPPILARLNRLRSTLGRIKQRAMVRPI